MADTILEVKNLTKYFKTKHGMLHAVDGTAERFLNEIRSMLEERKKERA